MPDVSILDLGVHNWKRVSQQDALVATTELIDDAASNDLDYSLEGGIKVIELNADSTAIIYFDVNRAVPIPGVMIVTTRIQGAPKAVEAYTRRQTY